MSSTIFVVRTDGNEQYDRANAEEYAARLKREIARDSKNISFSCVMTREIKLADRVHVEIMEVPGDKVEEYKSLGFVLA